MQDLAPFTLLELRLQRGGDPMQILVIDSNLVFAKKVGDFLNQHLKIPSVEYATNGPVLKRRLKDKKYDYIIADVFTAFDSEAMQSTLKHVNTPMLVWSILKSPDDLSGAFKDNLTKRIIQKPDDDAGIEAAMTSVMLQAVD